MEKFEKVKLDQKYLKKEIDNIRYLLEKLVAGDIKFVELTKSIFKLPLSSLENIEETEKLLESEENFSNLRELRLNFSEIKEKVVIGLWSQELGNYILSRVHLNGDELFKDVILYERIMRETFKSKRKKETKDSTTVGVTNVKSEKDTSQTETMKRNECSSTSKVFSEYQHRDIKCYNCGANGYIAKACTSEKKVITRFRCNEKGHKFNACVKPVQGDNSTVNLVATTPERSPEHAIPKEVANNNAELERETEVLSCSESGEDLFGDNSDEDPNYIPSDVSITSKELSKRKAENDSKALISESDGEVLSDVVQTTSVEKYPAEWTPINDNFSISIAEHPVKAIVNTDFERCKEPIDVYSLFITEDVIDLLITETNRYAEQ
ncbi:zinc finger cchc-type superfamily [Holotrichia oblita]|uniref:Zinc finger cchc-type superfamily n=1 Tax=Holotrichia oblita TaxID=644536 RepID=A0ACB9SK94_HOLOL|nr:zinc finger cchc-type superfamily [Holotrichia oblita]